MMSSSLPKRKPQQKENLSRLSNSKIMSAYSGCVTSKPASTDCLQPFLSSSIEQRLRTNSKRTARLKTGRKHQLSVQFILGSKPREPYSVRGPHPDPKTKQKRKKKEKNSHEGSRFIVPLGEFSKSNSLIVFSEKESTIGSNLFGKDKQLFFAQKYSPSQAATIIQKTWRGYLTRKLLDQYITDEQSKLNSVIKRIRSKEESFILGEDEQEVHVLSFSSIREGAAEMHQLRKFSSQHDEEETNAKCLVLHTTSQESSSKDKYESPQYYRSFFKNHRTEPDHMALPQIAKQPLAEPRKPTLALTSSLYNYSFCSQIEQNKILQFLENESLSAKIQRVSSCIEGAYIVCRKGLKEGLQDNSLQLQEMISRNTKIKEIFESSRQFMADVFSEVTAILADMQDVAAHGYASSSSSSPLHEPRSELFTIDMEENERDVDLPPASVFREGQLKLQSYLCDLAEEYKQNHGDSSELEFLCEILKVNSERGVRNITERCLLQFTVEIITENLPLEELRKHVFKPQLGDSREEQFLERWVEEVGKWEMGTIQEVTQAMESSSFINPDTSFLNLHEDA